MSRENVPFRDAIMKQLQPPPPAPSHKGRGSRIAATFPLPLWKGVGGRGIAPVA